MKCPYCSWEFTPTARHESEKVLPYCSLGCRRLSMERHVAFEEKHLAIIKEHEAELARAVAAQGDIEREGIAVLDDLPGDLADRLREFLRGWCRLPSVTRDVLALRLCGMSYATVGRLRGTSVQAAHKVVAEAAVGNGVVRGFAGLPAAEAAELPLFEGVGVESTATN